MANITLLDGAFGTEVWKLAERQGLEKISTWRYNAEAPQLVPERVPPPLVPARAKTPPSPCHTSIYYHGLFAAQRR